MRLSKRNRIFFALNFTTLPPFNHSSSKTILPNLLQYLLNLQKFFLHLHILKRIQDNAFAKTDSPAIKRLAELVSASVN
ncbi:hypothetical protein SAMN05216283_101846 [Sunxiuqinia elliptica]|uniref:Uncharacterized protein n=1 Tax=Sunxiuqinia elliptica TaxID=655355 RepID=A0A1I2CVI6_9BACT|nr:hypothetical protein SAMN05216283_101846 [Sunxiuqinia elliptica]